MYLDNIRPSSLPETEIRPNYLVQLALQCLNLSSQCLHLLCLSSNRLRLFGNQVLNISDVVLGDGSGGRRGLASE